MSGASAVERYDVHGVRVDVRCADATIRAAIDGRLRHFRAPADARADADVVFDLRVGADPDAFPGVPGRPGRPVYDAPAAPFLYDDAADELYVDYGGLVRLRAFRAGASVQAAVADTAEARMLCSHPLFTVAFLESMKRRAHFPLHAAGLARDGRAVLIPGGSGAGKTTLSVALACAGFGFLSDDLVFVRGGTTAPVVEGFPDEVDLLDDTVAMFPQLHFLAGAEKRPSREKHAVRLEDVLGTDPLETAIPAVLVLPARTGERRSRIEPMPRAEAMLELVSNVLLTDTASSQAHLDVLGALVNGLDCYRLLTGTDLDDAVAVVAGVLDATADHDATGVTDHVDAT